MRLADFLDPARPLLLVGCGRMGTALVRGWLKAGLDPAALAVVEPAGRPPLPDGVRHGLSVESLGGLPAPAAVVLAVKPQAVDSVAPGLACFAASEPLFVSIAAGVPLAKLRAILPKAVRAMPNTPAAIGKGITAAVAEASVDDSQRQLADRLLAAGGGVVWLEAEEHMDAVTAASGSGPAYVFSLTEALAAAGMAQGLPESVSRRLARETVIGAAHLMEQTDSAPGPLREQVTSPGGTTEAGLTRFWSDPGIKTLMEETVADAAARSRALGRGEST